MNILKNVFSFGFATFLSRILGFIRDNLIAVYLGAGIASDALFVAFRFPNTFRQLFAEGVFNSAFIPSYAKESKAKRNLFANQILSLKIIFIIIVIVIVEIFARQFLYLIAPGFQKIPEKFELAVNLYRISFPFLFFISIASVFSAILNFNEKFFVTAAAPIIFNGLLIVSLFLFHSSQIELVYASCITLVLVGFVQTIYLFLFLKQYFKLKLLFRVRINNKIRIFFKKFFPSVFASGINQLNILVGTIIASFQTSAVSYLYYADRIYQLPLALSGIAIGTVVLPRLSKEILTAKFSRINSIQNRSLELCLFLTLPAFIGIVVGYNEIIKSIFGFGSFNSETIVNTSNALFLFGIGLPAFALTKVYASFYFARHNTKLPFYISVFSVSINIIVSLIFFKKVGFLIIPFATSFAAWCTVIIYQVNLYLDKYHFFDKLFFIKILKTIFCTIIMGLVFVLLIKIFGEYLLLNSLVKPLTLISMVLFSSLIYFLCAFFIKAFSISDLKF